MSNDAVGHVTLSLRGSREEAEDLVAHTEEVMGTVVSFRVHCEGCDRETALHAVQEACVLLHEVDATFSTWRPDSPVSRLRRGEAGPAEMPPAVTDVLELCAQARDMSGGWFDPWALPGGVDPTGLVKGWSLDGALRVVREAGVGAALLNAGGDLCAFGRPRADEAWRIGIRHPWNPGALACIVRLDAAIATSGSYERGLHLVDPRSRMAALGAASATVTGPSLAMCDALATALAVGGDEAYGIIAELQGYEAYLIRQDGSEKSTASMAFA